MALEYRGREEFISEIFSYKNETDSTILESISRYQEKYDLDETYIVKNLFSPPLFDLIKKEARKLNLLKKEETDELF